MVKTNSGDKMPIRYAMSIANYLTDDEKSSINEIL